MNTTKTVTVCFIAFLASIGQLPAQTANYFTTLTNLMYTDAARARDFFNSLGEEEILTLCSQAFEHGWDSYVIGAGILQPTLGKRWEKEPPGYQEAVRIVTNTNYHSRIRCELGVDFLLAGRDWKQEEKFEYLEILKNLLFAEDVPLEDRRVLSENIGLGLRVLMERVLKEEELSEREKEYLLDLARYAARILAHALERVDENRLPIAERLQGCFVVCHILGLDEEAAKAVEKATGDDSLRRAISQAREALVRVLLQKDYPPEMRKTVVGLNSVHGCELGALLTVKDLERLASDEAFKGREEDIERLRQKVATRIRTRDH